MYAIAQKVSIRNRQALGNNCRDQLGGINFDPKLAGSFSSASNASSFIWSRRSTGDWNYRPNQDRGVGTVLGEPADHAGEIGFHRGEIGSTLARGMDDIIRTCHQEHQVRINRIAIRLSVCSSSNRPGRNHHGETFDITVQIFRQVVDRRPRITVVVPLCGIGEREGCYRYIDPNNGKRFRPGSG